MTILLSDLDGLPVLTASVEGPILARLNFGVGSADEPLTKRGITHLVEHLALCGLGARPFTYNGRVMPVDTELMAVGTEDQVIEFLAHVSKSLRELPVDRFDNELRVLRVEESRHSAGQIDGDLALRFGASGPGASAYPEYGLYAVSAQEVQAWATEWFTAANAILMLSRPIPGLASLELPRRAAPAHRPLPPDHVEGRRWSPLSTSLVSVSFVRTSIDGRPVGTITDQCARERALKALRTDSALSYSVNAVTIPIAERSLLCQMSADAGAGSHHDVLEGLASTLAEIADQGPSDDEMALLSGRLKLASSDPRFEAGMLTWNSFRVRRDLPLMQTSDYVAAFESVTKSEVADMVRLSLGATLAIGPRELGGALPGWQELPNWSTKLISGKRFPAVEGQERGSLVVSEKGVMWQLHDRAFRSVFWDDCAVALCWENGARRLIGGDGTSVVVAPWMFDAADRLPGIIDEHVAGWRKVWPEPATAPKPREVAPPSDAANGPSEGRRGGIFRRLKR